jgi:hypothetical protein
MLSILSAVGWVIIYWVCWVVLAALETLVACVGLMLIGADVTGSEPRVLIMTKEELTS